jgi:hypothetical protein
MLKAEAELKAQIDALLKRAQQADEAEKNEPELDIPAEIARREARLAAITEARQRLEQRQRDADIERGRDPDDKPRGGGQFKRPFGVPEDKAQDNFTDPDSRIMERAGGGFDASHSAQTAVDDTAHIIVAAELTNCGSDAGELPAMLQAVKDNLGELPKQALADTGYKAEAVFEALADGGCDLVVAVGREGKQALRFDPQRTPHTAAMAAKLQATKARRHTGAASGSPSRPTAGSSTCSGSDSSACAGCTASTPSGSSCAWR